MHGKCEELAGSEVGAEVSKQPRAPITEDSFRNLEALDRNN